MNSATLRGEPGPLKNFAVLLSHETVRNFAARRGPPILADVVNIHALISHRFYDPALRSIQPCS
jgi:hypothetical protein